MYIGIVKWFNPDKGYGFLSRDGHSDVFVHISAVQKAGARTLREGQKIKFEVQMNPRNHKESAINLILED